MAVQNKVASLQQLSNAIRLWVRLIYLQLPYFTKEADDCENDFERIIYVLKHMYVLKRMPWILQDSVFKKLSEIAEVASLNKEERKEERKKS